MNCIQFEEMVHDLDRPGTRGAEMRESALAHAETCGHCAQLLTEVESLDMAMRAMASRDAAMQTPQAIEAVLVQKFRDAKAASPRRRVTRQIAAFGIAAAAVLAFGIGLHRFAPRSNNGTANVTQTNGPVSASNEGTQMTPTATQSDSDAMASFIPLPYADDPQGLEGGAVVRVELSGQALVSLGMPVALAGSSGTVSADLLVSNDGTPQAIRLVSQGNTSEE